jgi:Xaa-Pro aminopeptidase
MHTERLNRLRKTMAEKGLGALLVIDISNVFYLSGFTGSTAAMVVTFDSAFILVDPRYSIQARQECPDVEVRDFSAKSAMIAASELINELKPKSVGYESRSVTIAGYRELHKNVNSSIRRRSTEGLVEKLRRIKDAHEIEMIREAARIADATYEAVLGEIGPGVTEKHVALVVDCTLRRLGADKEAFETIAAAGPNSACPHHSPTDFVLKPGQLLKLDFGARYRRYNSDITRTVCLGEPSAKQREVYQLVLDAQLKAIDAIRPGGTGKEIDAVARDYITSQGYGECFGHGLGHALGIDTHDGPGFSKTSDIVLAPGMVITVEPGIYIEGWGGVRIEDDVLVTEDGAEVITSASKELRSV